MKRKKNKTIQKWLKKNKSKIVKTIKIIYETMKKLQKVWTACIVALIATSCNVTRVITNESQYLQKGDTSIVIQTKTIETYNAQKN